MRSIHDFLDEQSETVNNRDAVRELLRKKKKKILTLFKQDTELLSKYQNGEHQSLDELSHLFLKEKISYKYGNALLTDKKKSRDLSSEEKDDIQHLQVMIQRSNEKKKQLRDFVHYVVQRWRSYEPCDDASCTVLLEILEGVETLLYRDARKLVYLTQAGYDLLVTYEKMYCAYQAFENERVLFEEHMQKVFKEINCLEQREYK